MSNRQITTIRIIVGASHHTRWLLKNNQNSLTKFIFLTVRPGNQFPGSRASTPCMSPPQYIAEIERAGKAIRSYNAPAVAVDQSNHEIPEPHERGTWLPGRFPMW